MLDDEGAIAPVAPPTDISLPALPEQRRKPNRGKAGGRVKFQAVRLSDHEEALLKIKAAEAGLSVSSFLRACALGDAGPRARRSPTIEKELLGATLAELNRIGNNVNQIARVLNLGQERDPADIAATMKLLRDTLTVALRAINA